MPQSDLTCQSVIGSAVTKLRKAIEVSVAEVEIARLQTSFAHLQNVFKTRSVWDRFPRLFLALSDEDLEMPEFPDLGELFMA